ncbi:flotillin-like protein FloA [Natronogracilivirga saccharolytica]|uniref:Flotillin-like protein FloA n=1 Tax=Natronogracilivirga saccharolytica TaxID=2812953 RepID=A0A8J7SB22_9BACT|nr:flotillin-like protein FloA [Natronogracilivirga saccharolytica]MBP3193793.1 flotillin-like protein FloA [Natronogracilivirga saccharolytica]
MEPYLLLAITGGVILLLFIFFYFIPIGLWITALFSGVRIGIFRDLVAMRLRKVPPGPIVKAAITATKAGIEVEIGKLEAHYLAGGNVQRVVNALISADKANIALGFERAAAIDLAGRDVFEAVQISVNPKVINTPVITALAKDGIQVKATARVTVRANLDRLVGGATEETVLARVGEGIVSTVGSSTDHKAVLENPDQITKTVLDKGLDSGTAFDILSIDIADVDVGENIGAKLQTDQASADLKVARARAEERRAMAVAVEQENRAKIQEMQARVVEAEAEVPKAISQAFRDGKLGVMDYYNMKNVMSDTDMRESIAKGTESEDPNDPHGDKPSGSGRGSKS